MKIRFKILAAAIMACLAVMYVKADSLNVHVVSGTDVGDGRPHYNVTEGDTTIVSAVFNSTTKVLSIAYGGACAASNINIYKNGNVVSSIIHTARPGDIIDFNLSSKGKGEYEVVVVTFEDETLSGRFFIDD